jgi:hypothetical protein
MGQRPEVVARLPIQIMNDKGRYQSQLRIRALLWEPPTCFLTPCSTCAGNSPHDGIRARLPGHCRKIDNGQDWEPDPWIMDERFTAVNIAEKGSSYSPPKSLCRPYRYPSFGLHRSSSLPSQRRALIRFGKGFFLSSCRSWLSLPAHMTDSECEHPLSFTT